MGELIETNSYRLYVPDCFCCFDTGHILYTKIINEIPYEFVARCYCQAGNKYSEGVPIVTTIYDKYEITKKNFIKWYERHKDKPELIKKLIERGVLD